MFLYFTTFTSHSFHILFLTDQLKGFVSIFQLLGRYIYVAVNFFLQLIFIFPLFFGMVMYDNEFKTKEK